MEVCGGGCAVDGGCLWESVGEGVHGGVWRRGCCGWCVEGGCLWESVEEGVHGCVWRRVCCGRLW